jgi:histidinol dehydrogenase
VIEVIRSREKERLAARLQAIRDRNVALDESLAGEVAAIIRDVRTRGDAALIDYTARFDGVQMRASELRVPEESLNRSALQVDSFVLESLREAIRNVRLFHEHQREESWEITTVEGAEGVRLGQRINPIGRAGLYVPGGTAAYPSSVVMNVVPAQVAGVRRILRSPRPLSN